MKIFGYLGMWLVDVDCPLSELADQLPDEECTGSSLSHFLLANPTFPLSLSLTDAAVDDSIFFNCFNLIFPQSFNKSRLDFFSVVTTVVQLDTISSESLLLSDKDLKIKRHFFHKNIQNSIELSLVPNNCFYFFLICPSNCVSSLASRPSALSSSDRRFVLNVLQRSPERTHTVKIPTRYIDFDNLWWKTINHWYYKMRVNFDSKCILIFVYLYDLLQCDHMLLFFGRW